MVDHSTSSTDVTAAISAANRVLGLADDNARWQLLNDGARSVVLRGECGIVKWAKPDAAESHTTERLALEHLNARHRGLAPEMLTSSPAERVIVLEDLGEEASLADALLGTDADAARQRLGRYIDALAELHTRTWTDRAASSGLRATWLRDRLDRALATLRSPTTDLLPRLQNTAAVDHALGAMFDIDQPARVFSFGDMCPDNNLVCGDRLRFFDLEGAGYAHPAMDLANLSMPFPTCWCCFDLPESIKSWGIERYSAAVGSSYAADALHLTEAVYTLSTVAIATPYLIDADIVRRHAGVTLPSHRTRLLHYVRRCCEHPDLGRELPMLASWFGRAESSLSTHWPDTAPMPIARAFDTRELSTRPSEHR